jgi:molecular chaperone DnaK (HSP70)
MARRTVHVHFKGRPRGLKACLPGKSGETTLIGAAAKQQASNNPYNSFHSFKRLMGRSYREVRGQLGSMAYGVVEAFDGSAGIWCPAM